MEKRKFIFIWELGVGTTTHDTSIINSLPRNGDEITDDIKFTYGEKEKTFRVQAKIENVTFDYINGIVIIYCRVVHAVKTELK